MLAIAPIVSFFHWKQLTAANLIDFLVKLVFLQIMIIIFLSHPVQVCWWDDRKGGKPEGEINLSVSHIEPVYKTMWISSKTASEFFTASTDGTVGRGFPLKNIWPLLPGSLVGYQEV